MIFYELLILATLVLPGCSTDSEPKLVQTELVGRVVGYEGQPMVKARAVLALIPMKRPLNSVEADEDGRFRERFLFLSGMDLSQEASRLTIARLTSDCCDPALRR